MKNLFLCIFACGITFSALSQSKLDLHSRALLQKEQIQLKNDKLSPKTSSSISLVKNGLTMGMIKLAEGVSANQLIEEGVNVHKIRGNFALVSMPINEVERISKLNFIKSLQLSRNLDLKMDKARISIGVDKIHGGADLPQAYTGKGVITGIIDNGVDPHHINFKDADGNSRIGYFSHIYINDAYTEVIADNYTKETISDFITDDSTTYHGTHTLGIMSGSYKGYASVAEQENESIAVIKEIANPFYGNAIDAELAVACPQLSDMLIIYGIENIIDYAQKKGKPAVINMSIGSNIGPHDGNSTLAQWLNSAGEDAIICISAGNEGDLPIALNQTFTTEDKELKTFIASSNSFASENQALRYGQSYIYSNDTTKFDIKAVIWDKSNGTIIYDMPINSNKTGELTYYSSTGYMDGAEQDINFNNAFQGYVGIGTDIDENSNRYYALIDYLTVNNSEYNPEGNYILGFIVTGKEGQRIDCFCDASFTYFDDFDQTDWDTGSCNGSINDMACAHNLIAVGSYNTRDHYASLDGKIRGFDKVLTEGDISYFSSYGTLIDGRNLPLICAPGAAIISSSSTPYINYFGTNYDDIQAEYIEPDRNNYWQQAMGTSMSCPVVSGSIALWLEADPTLTIHEAKDVIVKTAKVDAFVTPSVQWGAGKFDAYAGLKEVIRRSGIDKVSIEDKKIMVTTSDSNLFNIFIGNINEINATIYNIAGQPVLQSSIQGDELNIDASELNPGIYILNVNGQYSQRIIVK